MKILFPFISIVNQSIYIYIYDIYHHMPMFIPYQNQCHWRCVNHPQIFVQGTASPRSRCRPQSLLRWWLPSTSALWDEMKNRRRNQLGFHEGSQKTDDFMENPMKINGWFRGSPIWGNPPMEKPWETIYRRYLDEFLGFDSGWDEMGWNWMGWIGEF